jgi:hypothetical protein
MSANRKKTPPTPATSMITMTTVSLSDSFTVFLHNNLNLKTQKRCQKTHKVNNGPCRIHAKKMFDVHVDRETTPTIFHGEMDDDVVVDVDDGGDGGPDHWHAH